MRAIRYHEGGDPSVLTLDHIDRPTQGANEVLIEIRAASINPTDAKRRLNGIGSLPKTTGSDFAGVVTDVGSDVSGFSPGDRVCGTGLHTTRFQQGSFAEYVSVPTDIVTKLPDDVTFETGAAVALVGVTAWRGLIDHAGLQPTDRCLIHGGTGGVGHIATQLSTNLHAHTVTTASPAHGQEAKHFGADEVFDYDHPHLRTELLTAVERGYDVIFDHRAHDYFTIDIEVASFNGRIVLYGGIEGEVMLSNAALKNNITIHIMTMSNLATHEELPSIASVLSRVLLLVDKGVITPHIARSYALEEAAEVHRAILEDSFVGKLVVIP